MTAPQLSSENAVSRPASLPVAALIVLTDFEPFPSERDFNVIELEAQRRNARSAYEVGNVINQECMRGSTYGCSSECECAVRITPVVVESWDQAGSGNGIEMVGKRLQNDAAEKEPAECLGGVAVQLFVGKG